MTRQEIFNTVAVHLFTQGEQASLTGESIDPNDVVCVYRTADNLKCAVGCLIPDEVYNTRMEEYNVGIFDSPDFFEEILPSFFISEQNFLLKLQVIHDAKINWSNSENMRDELRGFGMHYDLDVSILEDLKFAWEE